MKEDVEKISTILQELYKDKEIKAAYNKNRPSEGPFEEIEYYIDE